ncbi:MAG: TonB family protein [Nitrospirales bacterium]|nr:TonB family protein [Nitrospirales bacterium]
MTLATLEALSVSSDRCRVQAWAGSTLVHGLCVGLAILFMTDFQPTTQSEPLRLDIAFIQPAPPEILKRLEPQELPKPMPVSKKVVQEKVVPPTPIQQPMIEEEPVIEERRVSPTMKTQEVHRFDPVLIPNQQQIQEPVQAKPILKSTAIDHDVMSELVKHIYAQTAHSKIMQQEKPIEEVRPIEQERPNEQLKSITQRETSLVQQEEVSPRSLPTPVTESQETVELAYNAPTHTPVIAERVTKSVPFEPVLESMPMTRPETAMKPQPIQKREEVVEPIAPVAQEDPIVRERPAPQIHQRTAAVHRPIQSYPETQADYGWLAQTIWNQIEKYKRYPTKARQNEWEGKVVLEAVIRQDGTILNLRVSETSGHDILDQDALNLLWKLSPLTLDHALDRSQITILVPLTYQLDG